MTRLFEKFYIQELIEIPSPWGSPMWMLDDGTEFQGLYALDGSMQVTLAGAQGINVRGRIICNSSVPLKNGLTVRRVRDNVRFKIFGDPKKAPAKAKAQVQSFEAEVTN